MRTDTRSEFQNNKDNFNQKPSSQLRTNEGTSERIAKLIGSEDYVELNDFRSSRPSNGATAVKDPLLH